MSDIHTYTASSRLPAWAGQITDAIRVGDLDTARRLFVDAATETSLADAVYTTAAAVEPHARQITVGALTHLYANPWRIGYGWRCGACLHAARTGGSDPAAGVNYKTLRGANSAAREHTNEEHAGKVPVEVIR